MMSTLLNILKKGVSALVVLGLFVGFFLYLQQTGKEVVATTPEEQIWTVDVVSIEKTDASPIEQAFGTVSASRDAQLRFGVVGEVVAVSDLLRNGVDIKAGEVLAELDTERFLLALEEVQIRISAETNQMKQLSTQLALKQRMLERAKSLYQKSVGSEADVDVAELGLSVITNQLEQSKSKFSQLQIEERQKKKDIEDAVLRAPFTGTLSGVDLAIGNQVSSAHLVATLTDLSRLEVSFVVPASIYSNISNLIDDEITLRWSSGGSVVKKSIAMISRAEAIVDKADGGGRIYAELPHDGIRTIPPGAFVEIAYVGRSFIDVFELPEESLVGINSVFIDQGGRASERKIEIMHHSLGKIWVKGELQNGDKVIATRLPGIGEGLRVRPTANAS